MSTTMSHKLLVGLAFFPALGLAVEVEPAVSVGLVHTDNLTLSAVEPISETILQVSPTVGVTHESARFTTNAAYRMEAFYYDELGDDEIFHLFDGTARADLIDDRLFLDFGGSRTRSIVDREAPIPVGNLPLNGNRVDRDEYFVGPSFVFGLGGNTTARGSLRRTWVSWGDTMVSDSLTDFEYDQGALSVDNYARGRGFTWAARYTHDKTDFGGQYLPYEYRRAAVELGVWAGEATRVFVAGGQESPWDRPEDPAMEDGFWEAGFAQTFGEQFSAEFGAGERTFGRTRRGQLSYRFRRGSTVFNYAETPTTNAFLRFDRGGLLVPEQPDDYLFSAMAVERFISKSLQWSVQVEMRRTRVLLAVFDERRQDRTLADGVPLGDQSQRGGNATVSQDLGARTQLVLSASIVERELFEDDESTWTVLAATANYRLSERSRLALTLQRSEEDTENPLDSRNYSAELLSLFFTRSF